MQNRIFCSCEKRMNSRGRVTSAHRHSPPRTFCANNAGSAWGNQLRRSLVAGRQRGLMEGQSLAANPAHPGIRCAAAPRLRPSSLGQLWWRRPTSSQPSHSGKHPTEGRLHQVGPQSESSFYLAHSVPACRKTPRRQAYWGLLTDLGNIGSLTASGPALAKPYVTMCRYRGVTAPRAAG